MHRRITILVLAIAASLVAPVHAADWQRSAQQALRVELQVKYPDVKEWSISSLLSRKQEHQLADLQDAQVTVLRVGARSAVRLVWKTENRSARSTVWFAVEGSRRALTASASIAPGTPLEQSAVHVGTANAFVTSCTPIQATERLAGMRAKRWIAAQEPLCVESLEPQPFVARGEQVSVQARVGLVTITAKGIAQEDGELGQELKIKNPSSGEVYIAAVTARGEVTVGE